MWMLSLLVGYFLYESDADNWWWTAYWIIIGFKVVEIIFAHKEKKAKEIEESRKYWEGK